jgi:methyltransferase (TIGR00027 family)
MTNNSTTSATLASTASWTAAVRALESQREDRLFDDPWAKDLAGESGMSWIKDKSPESVVPIVLRTRYFDDQLKRIARDFGIRQIVLLGAGLDTRAFRLEWPAGTRLFEVDQPMVLERKESILKDARATPWCERIIVPADLEQEWADLLVRAGYRTKEPSCWLLEGFLFYLGTDTVTALLAGVSEHSAPGSWLCFDIINGKMLTSQLTRQWLDMQRASGAPWIGALDDPVEFLAPYGWKATLTQAGQPDANHGRWTLPVFPTTHPDMPHNWFVVAPKEASITG